MVWPPGEGVRYNVESPLPVGLVQVELGQLLLPSVVAGLHEFELQRENEWSVVSMDSDPATEQIVTPLVRGMHKC
jgi:hypothetical protein